MNTVLLILGLAVLVLLLWSGLISKVCDLTDAAGQHNFSKVMAFGALLGDGVTIFVVLLRGGHFDMWDVAALALLPLIPHAYGLATKGMKIWAWVKKGSDAPN